ncbi:hypothetical protein CC1G_02574 [Coprinopsis cinerea okayama7|uniref:Uncharacterized protein n=1 Tax=Coprinopsis cinerea (strain Okayama-7 / 130 / ATCC MYA-4618 / FGSC 9003) TaxID=240176 RepID=A8PB70_COPC7|nr:hypothetical protein CC1G_02574 [Coprinopsis cinerea okayama7\|eukprot:XP_001840111.2 hypothetical protein CC1G_02574 [Coprinopsis cinerea okayama7\
MSQSRQRYRFPPGPAADQRLARSNEPGHPILDVSGPGRCLEFILVIITRALFPEHTHKSSANAGGSKGVKTRLIEKAFYKALERVRIHHLEWFRLYTRPSFMAAYFVLTVFKGHHHLEGIEFNEPLEESVAEVIVRTFALFYTIASKWQHDPHGAHITSTKFFFGDSPALTREWYKRWVRDLERAVLPVLDYNIAVTPDSQWAPFLAYLFVLTRDDDALKVIHESTLPTLRLLLMDRGELMREVQESRAVVGEAVPWFVTELCGDVAKFTQ